MPLSKRAHSRLAGLWGSYDSNLIRDKHFVNEADFVERFLEKYTVYWSQSHEGVDLELARKPKAVRRLIADWARSKLQQIDALSAPQRSSETLRLACKIAPICLIPLTEDMCNRI